MPESNLIPFNELQQMGRALHASGLFPSFKSEAQAIGLLMLAQAEGVHPVMATRKFHIMHDGKPTMRSDAMLAGYRAKGGKVRWKTAADDKTAQVGEWEFEGTTTVIGFTMAEAIAAGYTTATPKPGSGWARDPAAMLRARTISRATRMLTPEVVVGLYTPEEVEDFAPEGAAPAKAARATKAAPDMQSASVVGSEPLAASSATAAAPAGDAAAEEAKRRKHLRAELNKALTAITDSAEQFQVVRREFGKNTGKEFEKELTGVREGETFLSLMQEHWLRIGPANATSKWRAKLQGCLSPEMFGPVETEFLNTPLLNESDENAKLLDAMGKKLKIEAYLEGAA